MIINHIIKAFNAAVTQLCLFRPVCIIPPKHVISRHLRAKIRFDYKSETLHTCNLKHLFKQIFSLFKSVFITHKIRLRSQT